MKVTFKTNLGSRDAQTLGVDHTVCLAGETVDVSKEAGDELLSRGWVELPSKKVTGAPDNKPSLTGSPGSTASSGSSK